MIAVSCGKEDSQDAVDKRVKEIWGEIDGEKRELLWSFAYDNEGRVAEAINRRGNYNDIHRYDYSDNMVVVTSIYSNPVDGSIKSYKYNYYLDNDGFLVKNDQYNYFYENGYLSKEIGTFVEYNEKWEQISGEYVHEYIWNNGNIYGDRTICTLPNGDIFYEYNSEALIEYSNILNKTSINIGYYIGDDSVSGWSPTDGLFFMKFKGTYCKYMPSCVEGYINGKITDGEFSCKWDYEVDQDGFPIQIIENSMENSDHGMYDCSVTYYIIYE